jgi:molybdate transport repressor ModE-like protein
MLDVKRLSVLEAVERHGSFTMAAQAMNYTQSAISQQVAALEREVGTSLVGRSGRQTWLTEAGQALVSHTRRILAAIHDAEAELAGITGLRSGNVRLAAFPSAGAALVPRAATAFRARHPDVTLQLTAAEPRQALDGLRAGAHDVIVTIASQAPQSGNSAAHLSGHKLLDDRFSVVLPAGHHLASRSLVNLHDLAAEDWIATSPAGHPDADTLISACSAAGFAPRVRFHVDDYVAVQGFIAAGAGVALIPGLALTALRPDVVVRPASPVVRRRVQAVTLASRHKEPAVQAILNALQDAARETTEAPLAGGDDLGARRAAQGRTPGGDLPADTRSAAPRTRPACHCANGTRPSGLEKITPSASSPRKRVATAQYHAEGHASVL